MAEIAEIIDFVKLHSGTDNITEHSDIGNDCGIDGDDYDALIGAFAQKYNVDISGYKWYFHSSEEGSWNSIGGMFIKSPDKLVKYIPVTPALLAEFSQTGKWSISYPDHTFPKKRYDILINRLIALLIITAIVWKCVF